MTSIILALIAFALCCKFASSIRDVLKAICDVIRQPEK